MIFIDTNIWCYFFDEKSKEHKKASKFIKNILGREEIVINTIVAMELSHYLVKILGPVHGKKKIEAFLSFGFIIDELDFAASKNSIDILCEYSHKGIGGRDATILASMKRYKIKKLATHDNSFKEIGEIEVFDPAE